MPKSALQARKIRVSGTFALSSNQMIVYHEIDYKLSSNQMISSKFDDKISLLGVRKRELRKDMKPNGFMPFLEKCCG